MALFLLRHYSFWGQMSLPPSWQSKERNEGVLAYGWMYMYNTYICNHLYLYSVKYGFILTFSTLMHHCMGHSGPRHFFICQFAPFATRRGRLLAARVYACRRKVVCVETNPGQWAQWNDLWFSQLMVIPRDCPGCPCSQSPEQAWGAGCQDPRPSLGSWGQRPCPPRRAAERWLPVASWIRQFSATCVTVTHFFSLWKN